MAFFADITFIDVALTLTALGLFERFVLPVMPEELVGPEGLLLKTAE